MRATFSRGFGLVLAVIILLAPEIFGSDLSRLAQLEYVVCLMLISVGVNIATGFAGQLTLGPGATFGVAAYACVILLNDYPTAIGFPLLCVIGIAAGGVFGLLVGLPSLRVSGFYLAVITLFIALALPAFATALHITGSTQGISLLSNMDFKPGLTGSGLYTVMAVILLLVVALSWLLLKSRLGRKLLTLRTSTELAQSLGHTAYRAKLLAVVLSSLPAGLAGALYVYSQQFVSPGSIPANLSIWLVAACVIGGFGTIWGPVLGGALVFGIQLNISSLAQWQGLIFGAILALFAILIPSGVVGTGRRWLARFVPADAPGLRLPARFTRPVQAGDLSSIGRSGGSDTLTAGGVTVKFGGVVALNDVITTFRRGQVNALIGSNGSGKTTLLNTICGYVRVVSGTTKLADTELNGLDPSAVARRGIARTFQTPKLVENLSVLENVLLAVERQERVTSLESMLRLPRAVRAERKARAVALAALGELGLADFADQPAGLVPHGRRRLVEVARCVATPAEFVLLDEPAAGLSPSERVTLVAAIRHLAERGSGVVLIEHDTSFVFELAQSVTVLHRGSVLATGTADEIKSHPEVVRAYLGESALPDEASPQPLPIGGESQ